MNVEDFDAKKGKAIVTIVIVVAIIVIIIVFGKNIADFISNLFGKTTDPVAIAAHQYVTGYDYSSSNSTSPFSPTIYNNRPSGQVVISDDVANQAARSVNDATGFFWWLGTGIDAGEALAGLKNCKTQCDVSYVSIVFAQKYSTDMYIYMSKYFNSDTNIEIMKEIITFCISLPVY